MSAQTSLQGMEDDLLSNAEPCPFCDCEHLRVTDWWDDDGEYPAIECVQCKGSAPAATWNRRSGAGAPLDEVDDCLIDNRDKLIKRGMDQQIANIIRAFNRETGLVVEYIEMSIRR